MKILIKILTTVAVLALTVLLSLVWLLVAASALVEMSKGHLLLPMVYVAAVLGLISPLHSFIRILMVTWIKNPNQATSEPE